MKIRLMLLASCLLLSSCASARLNNDGLPASPINGTSETREVVTLPSGLKYRDLKIGNIVDVAAPGKLAFVACIGYFENGSVFDSTFERREPLQFRIGYKQVIAGLEQGVIGMKPGGTRQLTVPAELGYGTTGVPGRIPPNVALLFEITLLELEK